MIILKSPSELARMRQAGRIVAGVLAALQENDFRPVEPMVNQGDWRTRVLADNWTVVTRDGKLSACLGRETFGDQSNCVY